MIPLLLMGGAAAVGLSSFFSAMMVIAAFGGMLEAMFQIFAYLVICTVVLCLIAATLLIVLCVTCLRNRQSSVEREGVQVEEDDSTLRISPCPQTDRDADVISLSAMEVLLPPLCAFESLVWNDDKGDQRPPPMNPDYRSPEMADGDDDGEDHPVRCNSIERVWILSTATLSLVFLGVCITATAKPAWHDSSLYSSPRCRQATVFGGNYECQPIRINHARGSTFWSTKEDFANEEATTGPPQSSNLYKDWWQYFYQQTYDYSAVLYDLFQQSFVDDYQAILLGVHHFSSPQTQMYCYT